MACGCKNKQVTEGSVNMSADMSVEPVVYTAQRSVEPVSTGNAYNEAMTSSITSTNDSPNTSRILRSLNYSSTTSESKPVVKQQWIRSPSEGEAGAMGLEQCYLCAKKHIARAQEFFQEYHTGYPDHIKNLIKSVRVAERNIRTAFLLWQRTMAQLNMGEGEFLGKNANELDMEPEHINIANRIRSERIRLEDNPLYVPDFDQLLVDIHTLQYRVMELK